MAIFGDSILKSVYFTENILIKEKVLNDIFSLRVQFAMSQHWLTHWPLGDLKVILKMEFSILFYWLESSDLLMIMASNKHLRT